MHDPIASLIAQKRFVLLDGALATELEARGVDLDDALWSAKALFDAQDVIEAVHSSYFEAGADVATSASYQATFEGFAARGIGASGAAELFRRSIALAVSARDRNGRGLVAASVGCYGASLHDGSEYRGDYGLSRAELRDFHRERLAVLSAAGADLLAFETIPSRVEAEAITDLLADDPMPSWISFSCRNETEVSHGEPFAECVAIAARSPSVVAVGVNCTPPQLIAPLLRSADGATPKPLLAYPNSGEGWDGERHVWTPAAAAVKLEEHVSDWHALGARLIGGCCRTSPDTILKMAAALS